MFSYCPMPNCKKVKSTLNEVNKINEGRHLHAKTQHILCIKFSLSYSKLDIPLSSAA